VLPVTGKVGNSTRCCKSDKTPVIENPNSSLLAFGILFCLPAAGRDFLRKLNPETLFRLRRDGKSSISGMSQKTCHLCKTVKSFRVIKLRIFDPSSIHRHFPGGYN
jgi:hypothetical protein